MSATDSDSKIELTRSCGSDSSSCCASLPEHHARYARAWGIYQSDDLSLENYETLEAEMDAAQNLFSWEEFQEFKLTLDGFEEAWAGWRREFLSLHNA